MNAIIIVITQAPPQLVFVLLLINILSKGKKYHETLNLFVSPFTY